MSCCNSRVHPLSLLRYLCLVLDYDSYELSKIEINLKKDHHSFDIYAKITFQTPATIHCQYIITETTTHAAQIP